MSNKGEIRRLRARVETLESEVERLKAELVTVPCPSVAPVRSPDPDPCETLITWGETPGTTKNG